MSYNTTIRRYWINRKTQMVTISKGKRELDPTLWEKITLEQYLSLLNENAEKYRTATAR